tara:strand:- start:3457 stop:4419 length:963 start_codon:yes stop_codon:yes gene_type:complete
MVQPVPTAQPGQPVMPASEVLTFTEALSLESQPWIWAIRGPVFSAKSTIALSIKGRKFVFDLEQGVKRAAWRYPHDYIETWHCPPNVDLLTYGKGDRILGQRERWEMLTHKYIEVLGRKDIDVIIFDTSKEVWTIAHQCHLQEKQETQLAKEMADKHLTAEIAAAGIGWRQSLQSIEYAIPNQRMSNFIKLSREYGKSLVLINHERPVYGPVLVKGVIEMMPTGSTELDGFKSTFDLADWMLVTEAKTVAGEGSNKQIVFGAVITKCPIGAGLVGQHLVNPEYSQLETLMKLPAASVLRPGSGVASNESEPLEVDVAIKP